MTLSIEQRIDVLESREAIKELRAKYAWYAARADAAGMSSLFTENGVFEVKIRTGRVRSEGRQAIYELLSQNNSGTPTVVVPLVHNHVIIIDGDKAHGTCAMEHPGSTKNPNGYSGYYLETFRRENNRWLFSERRYLLYSPVYELPSDGSYTPNGEPASE